MPEGGFVGNDEKQLVLRSGYLGTVQRRTYGERTEKISMICRDKTSRYLVRRHASERASALALDRLTRIVS